MFNHRNLWPVYVSLFSLSASVWANTLPWQGPYAGVYLGGGFGNNNISTNAGSVTNSSFFTTSADINAVNQAGTWWKETSTVIVGLQAGHDWIWKQMVYGAALDYGALSLSSSTRSYNNYPDNSDQYSVNTSVRSNWLLTLRGRVGYQKMLKSSTLFYLTGGMAITRLEVSNSFIDNSYLVGMSRNEAVQNQIGWAAGGGIDVAAFNHVTVNIEYLYIGIPSIKTISSITNTQGGFGIPVQSMNNALSTTANFYANIFKIGLNYRFDE